MRRTLILVLVLALTLAVVGTGVALAKGAGNSTNALIYLYEKDPTNWEAVDDGAGGRLKYSTEGAEFAFHFNGHGLEPGSEYTLIYYPDPWPGDGLICFGSDDANRGGNVLIKGSYDVGGDLPIAADDNDGAKIWLVLSDDVDCEVDHKMIGWNPTEYLFENNLITYDYTG